MPRGGRSHGHHSHFGHHHSHHPGGGSRGNGGTARSAITIHMKPVPQVDIWAVPGILTVDCFYNPVAHG